MDWYYKIEEKQWGPVSVAQLLQLIHAGAIPPEGLVRQGETAPWISVDQIQSVLSGAGTLVPQPQLQTPSSRALAAPSTGTELAPTTRRVPVPTRRRRKKRRSGRSDHVPHPMMVAIGTALVVLLAILVIERRSFLGPSQNDAPRNKPSLRMPLIDRQQANDAPSIVPQQPTDSDNQLIERTDRSVVQIETANGNGSGFVIDSTGTIVTNLHVIQNTGSADVKFIDGSHYEVAGFIGVAEDKDLVLLRIRSSRDDFKALPITKKLPRKGETVYALGAPRGYLGSITDGIVSAIRSGTEIRQIAMDDVDGGERLDAALDFGERVTWIQTSSPISPGNSGGPLVNARGEVVGVNTWIQTDAQNVNFAVCSEDLQELVDNSQEMQPLAMLPAGSEPSFVTHQRRQEQRLREQRMESIELEKRQQRLASTSRSKRTARVVQELEHLQKEMKEIRSELKQLESIRAEIVAERERVRRSAKSVYLESENSAQRRRQSRADLARLNKILLAKSSKRASYSDEQWAEMVAQRDALNALLRHMKEHAKVIDRRHEKLIAQDRKLEEQLKFNFVDWQTKKKELSANEIRYVELGVQFPK
ncbi:MAG: trypsin-like peptidase domain-containing protein [Planctomycetota bacterium]|nr:trypsin-like peptidase domain-containing protein [Planctomycetota bacterium]